MGHFRDRSDHMLTGANIVFGSYDRMRNIVVRDGMSFIGICFSVAGLGVLGYQSLLWIKYGLWSPLAFRLAFELVGVREPLFAGQGAEKISAWICDLPLCGVLLAAGIVAITFGLAITAGGCAAGAAKSDRGESLLANRDETLSS
jgi:hypothetical protein